MTPHHSRERLVLSLILAFGLLLRLIVAVSFWGSRDVTLQIYHGERILEGRAAWTSKLPIAYFLPPLMQSVARHTAVPDYVAQKIPAIAGDMLAAILLIQIARRRRSEKPWIWAGVYLLNPLTVMLSAYHGNVDPLMAALILWALYLRWRERPVAAGTAFGLAVAMKPTAILALPVLLLPLARRGNVRVAAAAILVPAAICLPFVLREPTFCRFLATYSAPFGSWGISLLTRQFENVARQWALIHGGLLDVLTQTNALLSSHGRYLLIAVLVAWFVFVARRLEMRTFEHAALATAGTFLVFYVFTTGFGVQYLGLALPFLLIASVRLAMIYSAALSPFLVTTYLQADLSEKYGVQTITANLRLLSHADLALLIANGVLSIVAWSACAWILWRVVSSRRAVSARRSEPPQPRRRGGS